MSAPVNEPYIHFETISSRPRVFRMTSKLIAEAKARNKATVTTGLGEDLGNLSWLKCAVGLVSHNDVLINPKFPLRMLAQVAPHLRWIHITGAGIEPLLPLDWLPPGVVLTNNSGIHVEKMRESALMMLLMLNARVPAIASNQRKSSWTQIFSPAIKGRTVLVIGVGDMGGAVAKAAKELRLRVLGVRRTGASHPDVDQMFRPDDLDEVLPLADFIVLALPLTTDTTTLIDRRRIGLMKREAGFINIGRGGLVDHGALVEALKAGTISSAILDVFDVEPLPADSHLWKIDNLMIFPHVTSDDEDDYLPKTFDLVFENVRRLVAGKELLNSVDPQRGY